MVVGVLVVLGVALSSSAQAMTLSPLWWRSPALIDPVAPPAGGALPGVSCPSTSLCVAVDGAGNVIASQDPAGSAAGWSLAHVDSSPLVALSCPSVSLCVAVDAAGDVVASTNPAGGAAAWTVSSVPGARLPGPGVSGLSCQSASLCVAWPRGGKEACSSRPTRPAGRERGMWFRPIARWSRAATTAWTRVLDRLPMSRVPRSPCASAWTTTGTWSRRRTRPAVRLPGAPSRSNVPGLWVL